MNISKNVAMICFSLGSHCRTNTCSCTKSHIPCTAFCGCNNDVSCQNPKKMVTNEEEEEEDDETDFEDEDI